MQNPKCKKCGSILKVGGGNPDFIGDATGGDCNGKTYYYYCDCENPIHKIMEKFRLVIWGISPRGSLKRKKGEEIQSFIAKAISEVVGSLKDVEVKTGWEETVYKDTRASISNEVIRQTNQKIKVIQEQLKKYE